MIEEPFDIISATENESHSGPITAKCFNGKLRLTGTKLQLKMLAYSFASLVQIMPSLNFTIQVPVKRIQEMFETTNEEHIFVKVHQSDDMPSIVMLTFHDKSDNCIDIIKDSLVLNGPMPCLPKELKNVTLLCIDRKKVNDVLITKPEGEWLWIEYPASKSLYDCSCDRFTPK
jgi:hypothetical protein